jgi:small-conductance mechanosensitive channel
MDTNTVTNALTGRVEKALPVGVENIINDVLNPSSLHGALLIGLLFALAAWLVGRLLGLAIHRILERSNHVVADQTAVRFLGQLVRAGVYLFAFLTYARLVPALQSLGTAWLASVGVASVVFGLAAQNTLGNLIAGISLLLYRPFNLGDRVQVMAPTGLEVGIVESLNLGYTILRTPDHRRIVIPNSAMASQTSVNLSMSGDRLLCVIPVVISLDADLEKARNILTELAKQHPKTSEFAGCPITATSAAGVTLTVKIWCADFADLSDVKSDLLEAARTHFKTEGIELK